MRRKANRTIKGRSPQQRFHDGVFRLNAASCLMCSEYPVDAATIAERPLDFDWLQSAHVLAKRGLFGDQKSDPENGMVLCTYHHGRHDHWVERVPRALVPAQAAAFAEREGLAWLFDKEYPET